MAHFYGFIQGQAGDATRMGSKRSGYSAWAQSHQGRIRVELRHNDYNEVERDEATISIEGGHSAYNVRTHYLPTFDLTAVPAALSCGDPKMDRIWERIQAEFRKLDDEAPKALKRAARRQRKAERERIKAEQERELLVLSLTDAEIQAYMAVADTHDREYTLRLLKSTEVLERRNDGVHTRVTDWDAPTGLRDVNLTALAKTLPQDKLSPTLEGSEA